MNLRNLVVTSLMLGCSLTALSLAVNAKPLTLNNATNHSISVRVNYFCSTEFGRMTPYTARTVVEHALESLCGLTSGNCLATIYKSYDCSGPELATFTFDTKTGLREGFIPAQHYSLMLNYNTNTVSITQAVK